MRNPTCATNKPNSLPTNLLNKKIGLIKTWSILSFIRIKMIISSYYSDFEMSYSEKVAYTSFILLISTILKGGVFICRKVTF